MTRPKLTLALCIAALALTPSTVVAAYPIYGPQMDPKANFWIQTAVGTPPNLTQLVPQGLAHDPTSNRFLATAYDPRESSTVEYDSYIFVHDSAGNTLKRVRINTGHVGGITVWRDWVYVVTTLDGTNMGRLRKYSRSRIMNAAAGEYVGAATTRDTYVNAGAFVADYNGRLYFGTHTADSDWTTKGKMWSWPIDPDSGEARPVVMYDTQSTAIPPNVQGYVRTDNYEIFSQSWTRKCDSVFTVVSRGDGLTRTTLGPAMSEGIVAAAGDLYVNFESAAEKYAATAKNVTERVAFGDLSGFATVVLHSGSSATAKPVCDS